jgi:hypothetical protein
MARRDRHIRLVLRTASILFSFIAALYLMGLVSFLARAIQFGHALLLLDALMPFEAVLLFIVATFFFYKVARELVDLWSRLAGIVIGEYVGGNMEISG